jgi:hypothetical protein
MNTVVVTLPKSRVSLNITLPAAPTWSLRSGINWLRTLPYVRAWAEKYHQGLVVIGVHTPEFSFEHNIDNVRRALQLMRIT